MNINTGRYSINLPVNTAAAPMLSVCIITHAEHAVGLHIIIHDNPAPAGGHLIELDGGWHGAVRRQFSPIFISRSSPASAHGWRDQPASMGRVCRRRGISHAPPFPDDRCSSHLKLIPPSARMFVACGINCAVGRVNDRQARFRCSAPATCWLLLQLCFTAQGVSDAFRRCFVGCQQEALRPVLGNHRMESLPADQLFFSIR